MTMGRLGRHGKVGLAVILAALIAAAAAWTFSPNAAWADDGRPVLPKAKRGPCIASPAEMLRNHYAMLLHQRERTLRLGINGSKVSLRQCVACHAADGPDGKPIPVNAPGQFCDACHEYAAVSPDCFSCHAATPDKGDAAKTADAAGGAVKP